MVSVLKNNITSISSKDIINQNISIVDPLHVSAFSKDISGKFEGYRFIKFNKLTTILGKKVPQFTIPPSIICFSNDMGNFTIGEITSEGFYIKTKDLEKGNKEMFNVLISQKPDGIRYPPMVNAGVDQIIQLPAPTIEVHGTNQ